jgi:hypothetical protein
VAETTTVGREMSASVGSVKYSKVDAMPRGPIYDKAGEEPDGYERTSGVDASLPNDEMPPKELPSPGESYPGDDDTDNTVEDLLDGVTQYPLDESVGCDVRNMFTLGSDESCIILAGSAGIEPDNLHGAVEIEEESRYSRVVPHNTEQAAIGRLTTLQQSEMGRIESDDLSKIGHSDALYQCGGVTRCRKVEDTAEEGGAITHIHDSSVGESTGQIHDYDSDGDDDDTYDAREPKDSGKFQEQAFEKTGEHLDTGFIDEETKDKYSDRARAFVWEAGKDCDDESDYGDEPDAAVFDKVDGSQPLDILRADSAEYAGYSDDYGERGGAREPKDEDNLQEQAFEKSDKNLRTGCNAEEAKNEYSDTVLAFNREADKRNDDESEYIDEPGAALLEEVEGLQPRDNSRPYPGIVVGVTQTEVTIERKANHDDTTISEQPTDFDPEKHISLEKNPTQPHASAANEAPSFKDLTGSKETLRQSLIDTLERINEERKARLDDPDRDLSIAYYQNVEAQYTKPLSKKAQKGDPFANRLSRRQLFQSKGSLELFLDVANKAFLSPQDRQVLVVSKDNDKYLVPRYGPPVLPPQPAKSGAPHFKKGQKDGGYYIYISSSGNKYAGNFKDGKRHGYGIATYRDGEVYNGEWRCGRRHGRGVLHLAKSEVFDGVWLANKKHGLGVYYWTDGEVDISWYENNVRLESLRWTRDRRRTCLLDLASSKKEPISLARAANIVQDWERKHDVLSA